LLIDNDALLTSNATKDTVAETKSVRAKRSSLCQGRIPFAYAVTFIEGMPEQVRHDNAQRGTLETAAQLSYTQRKQAGVSLLNLWLVN